MFRARFEERLGAPQNELNRLGELSYYEKMSEPERYFHDPQGRQVWAVRNVQILAIDRNGKRVEWFASAEIEHIQADNRLDPLTRQWLKPVYLHPRQELDAHYGQDEALSYFRAKHLSPPGEEISGEAFEQLKAAYIEAAK